MTANSALEHRLDALERENRRWRRVAAASAITLVGMLSLALATPAPEEVKAKRFILVDSAGETIGQWRADHEGFPALHMQKGNNQVYLATGQPGVLVRGGDGRRGGFLGLEPDGSAKLQLQSERFIDGVHLVVRPDGSSGMYANDQKGFARVAIQTTAEGAASLGVQDERGRLRGALGLDDGKTSYMSLLDSHAQQRVGMLQPADRGDSAQMIIHDANGLMRGQFATNNDGSPSLKLYSSKGDVMHQVP